MVTSPDGMGVIVIGGKMDEGSYANTILESRFDGSNFLPWQIMDQQLEIRRRSHVVIPIPKSIANCGIFPKPLQSMI